MAVRLTLQMELEEKKMSNSTSIINSSKIEAAAN